VREPTQVFTLLKKLFIVPLMRRVFKVETVGDCYIAVMAKFVRDCVTKFNEFSKQLEISLGPDTANLAMRAGLHSGPVTAGVFRGKKAWFQLSGDTVNTAAHVEGTGQRNQRHWPILLSF
jgi:class 3 adenylate cyclase